MCPLPRQNLLAGKNSDLGGATKALGAVVSSVQFISLFCLVLLISYTLFSRLGVAITTFLIGGMVMGIVYAFISWRSLLVPLLVVILSVGGFRFLLAVKAPGLPDMYLDRLALLWLIAFFGIKSIAERRNLRGPVALDILIALNGIYILISSIVNDMAYFNLWTKSYLVPYLLYFMAKNIIRNQRQMATLFGIYAVLNVYYAVTSIAEKFRIEWLVWPKAILTAETVWKLRSNGPFEHAPLFGTVMGMILPVYLYFIVHSRNRLGRTLSYLALGLGLIGLYFTYTRGSWLAGIVALLVAVVLNRGKYVKVFLPALVVFPLLAVTVLGIGQDQTMKKRVENEDTVTSRLGVAVTAFRMFKTHPLFGVGFFQFRHVREDYVDPVEVPIFGTVRFQHFRHTSIHDIYLGPLAETGLLGAGLQIAIYLLIFRAFVRQYRRRDGPRHFRFHILPIFAGMCLGYLAGGIAIDYRFFSMVGAMFYVSAGVIYGYTGTTESAGEVRIRSGGD